MRRTRDVLRLSAHLLVAALVVEAAARIDDRLSYGAPLFGAYVPEMLRGTDSSGIPRNVPGARFEKWRINSLGFRGGEIPRDKPAGTFRIVCVGQSESFGLYESENGQWPARLGALVAEHAGLEVVNASVVGLGRRVRAPYLDRYVFPLQPDVLILFVNVLAEMRTTSEAGNAPEEPRFAWARPRFLPKLKRTIQLAVPDPIRMRIRAWRLERELRARQQSALGGRPPADVLPPENVAAFEEHLRELVRNARARGARPVLATYPVLFDERNREAYRAELAEELIWHPEWSEVALVDGAQKLNEAVVRVGRDQGVPVVDVASAVPRTREYFADGVHYTDRGAALVAERVRAGLEELGLLGPRPARAGAVTSSR